MIRNRLTLKQLEGFVAVVEAGSFRRAAMDLGTTQPNISNRIATLEDLLGVALMHRDGGSIRLTGKGEELLVEARNVLRAAEGLLETAQRRDLIEDRLKLGVTELVACTWLTDFMRAFRDAYPSVYVELQVDLSTKIDDLLHTGDIHLAFQTGPFAHKASTELPVGSYEYTWAATPELSKLLGDQPSLKSLFEHPILTHAQHTVAGRELRALCQREALPIDKIVHSSSLISCIPMAQLGMGTALLPHALVEESIDDGKLVLVPCNWLPKPLDFYARYNGSRVPNYVVRAAELAVDVAHAAR